MAKFASNSVLDASLDEIATSTSLIVCTTQPADRAAALATALADVTVDSGDFSIADGSPNGRTLTIAEQADIEVDATGNAGHVALIDGSELKYVTTVTEQTLTDGNTVTVPSWTIRIADPT